MFINFSLWGPKDIKLFKLFFFNDFKKMDRRRFIQSAVMGGTGYLLLGCGEDPPTGGGGKGGSGNGGSGSSSGSGSGGSSNSETPWDKYVPSVNDIPAQPPGYSAAKSRTDLIGQVMFDDVSSGKIYGRMFGTSGGPVSGLEVALYKAYEGNTAASSFFAWDTSGKYMPTLVSLDRAPITIPVTKVSDAEFRFNTTLGTASWSGKIAPSSLLDPDLFIQKMLGPLPSYDTKDMKDLPGYWYLGDWSFDNLKNLNTTLKFGSIGLVFINPLVAAQAYSLFSTTGNFLDTFDGVIDGVNLFGRVKNGADVINKGQEYSIYSCLDGSPRLVFAPSLMESRDEIQNVRDFFPLRKGDSWTFTDGSQTATTKVTGTKKVKGKDLISVRDINGIESYFGFQGSSLFQFGVSRADVGNIFFEPAVKIGDDKISVGSKYHTAPRIICEQHPEITGTATEDISWDARQNLLLSNRIPYGDCLRVRDSASVTVSGNSWKVDMTHWLAKNLGKVKMEFGGQTVELVDTNINSRMQGFGLLKPARETNQRIPSLGLSQIVVEACRRAI